VNRREILAGAAVLTTPPSSSRGEGACVGSAPLFQVETRTGPRNTTLYVPVAQGPVPGILLLHGSEGGFSLWTHTMAMFLASQGFVAAPFIYSRGGNAWHAGDILEVDLDDTVEVLQVLRANEAVSGVVGLWGISRGAEHVLLVTSLMASEGSPEVPRAVAVHAGSDVIVPAFFGANTDPSQPKPFDRSKRAWSWHGTSENLTPGSPIAIERYNGALFLSHGEADKVWSVERTRRLEARLKTHDRAPEIYYYPGEGHGLGPAAANLNRARLASFFRRHLIRL
jgi:dipeptidyl aminopeptidase/acylaminoacyl peptidase